MTRHQLRFTAVSATILFVFFVSVISVEWIDRIISSSGSALFVFAGPWLGILVFGALIIVVIWIASPIGRERVGGDNRPTRVGQAAFIIILVSISSANALVHWTAVEPVFHFVDNPMIADAFPGSRKTASIALAITVIHWGPLSVSMLTLVCLLLARTKGWRSRQEAQTNAPALTVSPSREIPALELPDHLRRDRVRPAVLEHKTPARWPFRHAFKRQRDIIVVIKAVLAAVCLFATIILLAEMTGHMATVMDNTLFPGRFVKTEGVEGGTTSFYAVPGVFALLFVVSLVVILIAIWPRIGMPVAGGSTIVSGTALLFVMLFLVLGTSLGTDTLLSIVPASILHLFSAFTQSIAATDVAVANSWSRNWPMHYMVTWILTAPVYAVAIIWFSKGQTIRSVALLILVTNFLVSGAWISVMGGQAVTTAIQSPEFSTQVMIESARTPLTILRNLTSNSVTASRLDNLFAAFTVLNFILVFAVATFALGRFATPWREPPRHVRYATSAAFIGFVTLLLTALPNAVMTIRTLLLLLSPVILLWLAIALGRRLVFVLRSARPHDPQADA